MNTATSLAQPVECRRSRDREASERRIRDAAVTLFARHGYDEVTVRMIAAEAQVNVALINRYYGSKLNLFRAAMITTSPPKDLSGLTPAQLPAYLAERAALACPDRPILRALARSTGVPEVRDVLRELVEARLVDQIAARLDSPDAHRRARTAAAVLMGAATLRAIFPVSDLPEEDLIERLKPIFHHCLFE